MVRRQRHRARPQRRGHPAAHPGGAGRAGLRRPLRGDRGGRRVHRRHRRRGPSRPRPGHGDRAARHRPRRRPQPRGVAASERRRPGLLRRRRLPHPGLAARGRRGAGDCRPGAGPGAARSRRAARDRSTGHCGSRTRSGCGRRPTCSSTPVDLRPRRRLRGLAGAHETGRAWPRTCCSAGARAPLGARAAFAADALAHHAVFPRGWREYVEERRRLRYFPAMAARVPELREHFFYRRVFLSRRTAAFDLALAGAAGGLLLRSPLPLLAAGPTRARSGAARCGSVRAASSGGRGRGGRPGGPGGDARRAASR